jgi:hypothetical protein
MIAITISLLNLGLICGGAVYIWRVERKIWNGGICECGRRWRHFGTDSQGGRGYRCDDCNKRIWISWPADNITEVRLYESDIHRL